MKFNLEDAKETKTSIHPNTSLGFEKEFKSRTTLNIGSLLYLTAYRPDIMFNVYLCVCFHLDPRELRRNVVKRIFRNLKGIANRGLFYKKRESYTLQGYCDIDYAKDKVE